ncbi:non-specific lipid transfer protein GPI-anchored 12-like [Curcuma longa]|uniref:non-specific lipid transfer protein GPI-anchored 12-like n=1 Tax=Curcuma longa TaxID=136217 RepID=UPI003D9EF4F0
MSNTRRGILSLLVHLSLLRAARPHGPSPAPAPSGECDVALQSLSRCSTYVEVGSNLSRPQKGCCRAVSAVAGADPACLCGLIDDYRGFGVRVDTTRALMLPSACRAPPPPPSLCAVLGMPVATAVPPSEEPGTGCCATGAPAAAASPPSKNGGCRLTTMVWCDPRYAFCLALLLLLLLSYSFPSS